jgi:nucleoside-diphosphate-sugar epimerase
MRNIVVTGGAGFVGYHLAKDLSEDGNDHVLIIDNFSKDNYDEEFKALAERPNVDFIRGDLTEMRTVEAIDDRTDHIYHLAAIVGVRKVMENPVETLRVNSLSTINILDHISSMRVRPKLLFTSSCENYAGTVSSFGLAVPTPEKVPLCIDDVENPRWTYAASKILGEIACLNYGKQFGFRTVVLRYHNIYGPRMGFNHVIPEFIARLKKGSDEFEVFGGYQSRSFCYVSDAVRMTRKLMESDRTSGKVFNVGSDVNVMEINEIARMLFKLMNVSPRLVEKGHPLGSVSKRVPDLSLIKSIECFSGEVGFEEGLRRSFDWYIDRLNGEVR